jgi:uncharacterized membrane protein YiaA
MPAVGIVLFLIGVWIAVRTLAGQLGASIARSSQYG